MTTDGPITDLREQIKNIYSSLRHFHRAEIFLIVVLILFGGSACFLLPVSGGYDEETHLLRVWEMSAFVFIPNDSLGGEMPFPAVYWEMSYRRQPIVRAVPSDFWTKYGDLKIDSLDYIYGGVETRSVYSPPLLLPQALVMRYFGRAWQFPALTVFYLIRLSGLLSYLVLAWLAVRFIPYGKWPLAVLAVTPVAILQAATITADSISNGLALLFIAGVLAVAVRPVVTRREWGILAFLFLILFWGKINLAPLAALPFMIIRQSRFTWRYGYIVLLVVAIAFFAVEELGWSAVAYSRLGTAPENTDPGGQIAFILSHPVDFILVLVHHIQSSGTENLLNWIAIYGYAYWPIPAWTYYLYVLALLGALFTRDEAVSINSQTRWVLILLFGVSYLATIASLYITFTPVGSASINGVQGRYFITVMPLLFLAMAGLPIFSRIQLPALVPAMLGAGCLLMYTAGMYLSYHVPCGSQYYRSDLCYQPNYKNWAPDALYSPPVGDGMTLKQEIVPECNGMTELRVWLDAEDAGPDGSTAFLFRDMGRDRNIIDESVPNSELPVKEWYTLRFPPDWASDGKFYLLTIGGGQSGNSGIRAAYSLRPEYPSGKLYENDQPITSDLIFQTGCIAGWKGLGLGGAP